MLRTTAVRRHRRPGFTLVELMVVIVILAILVALLVPVISGAVGTARDAQVTSEITILTQALASFNTRYGTYPPSRILVNELVGPDQYGLPPYNLLTITTPLAGTTNIPGGWYGTPPQAYSSPTDISVATLAQRSAMSLRKIFPKMGSVNSQTAGGSSPWHDYNGNGQPDQGWMLLEGHECLVLFLGGRPNPTGSSISVSGFSKNPAYPFLPVAVSGSVSASLASPTGTSPFFEFKSDRLLDDDGDGIPGYVDPRRAATDGRFYAYFSAYGSNGYDPNDMNMIPPKNLAAFEDAVAAQYFRVNFPTAGGNNPVASPAPNPYTSSSPFPIVAAGSRVPPIAFLNKESFQIITAGVDGVYGPGGQYEPDAAGDKLPANVPSLGLLTPNTPPQIGAPGSAASSPDAAIVRRYERDNLTNFNTGKLE